MLGCCLLVLIPILYFLLDINYFLRLIFTLSTTKLFQKKSKIMDETTIYGMCIPQDLDAILSNMSNSRYLREIDFSRFHYLMQTELFSAMRKMGATAVLGGSNARYRRPIPFFMMYKVTTKLIYWDDKSFYFEHKFINLRNNFIHAVILSKQTTIGMKMPINELLQKFQPEIRLPELQDDLRLWMESMECSSQKLRKKD
ncbi:PREDICTED: protein THEM6-like [Polistes dominula]|uniref:Protein THEM6 n=1 Tax=Polistes dominula TaxID=743375 RepID=A0ABM1IWQ0_POLDO|nr:PREDICTED: protein THEM6-like [Polistes dominula]